jgi:hypothetical protein
MTQSRQALRISIVYSIPLLLWFSAQLQFIDWNSLSLTQFFKQTLIALILLQVFSLALLFTNRGQKKMQDDLLAILFVMLYPLPLVAIIWLGGGVSCSALFNGLAVVGAAGGIAFLIQCCARLIPPASRSMKTGLSATHILPAVVIWNYRDLWQDLLQ